MSSPTSPDEAPFVFGVYASHLNDAGTAEVAVVTESVPPPLGPQAEVDRAVELPVESWSGRP